MNIESGPPWAFILKAWRFVVEWWPALLFGGAAAYMLYVGLYEPLALLANV